MVEKPDPSEAPSNLFINGRYILQPEIFGHLARQKRGAGHIPAVAIEHPGAISAGQGAV